MRGLFAGVGVAALALFFYLHRDWPRYWRLERDGVSVDGAVIGKRDGPPPQVDYSFQGPVKIQTATGEAGYGNPEYDQLGVGDRVIVFYLPDHPEVSMMGLPLLRFREPHQLLIDLLLLAGPWGAWLFWRELKRQAP